MLRFAKAAGIELTHIPYRGGAPAVADAIGGQVSMVMDGLAAAVPHLLDDMQRFVRADAEVWRPLVIASGATVD